MPIVSDAARVERAHVRDFAEALVAFALPANRIASASADRLLVLVYGLLNNFRLRVCVKIKMRDERL